MSTPANTSATPHTADARVRLPAGDAPVTAKAKTPISPGRITVLGIVMALATGALGLIGVHDALIGADLTSGSSWSETAIDGLDGQKPQWWAVAAGAVMILLGLWMLSVALRPRPRTAVALQSRTGVFLRPKDVERLAARAADDVDGVVTTHVSATRRAATMTVTVTGDDARISQDVREAVTDRLAALDPPPRLKIKASPGVAP